MSNYPTSTQKRFWILTPEDVERRRSDVRAKAIESAKETRLSTGEPLRTDAPEPLTGAEETLLRRYYEVKIQKVCSAFSLPTKVQATAISLFKRFLLGTSLLQHNLKVMMLTSIYVACKVEENYVSAEEFGKGMHEDASRVLNAELTLLAGLSFQLVTYSPYRSIEGFHHDIRRKLSNAGGGEIGKLTEEKLDECVAVARKIADKQLLTDAPLMHSPGKLALSALRSAARILDLEEVLQYVQGVEKQSIEGGEKGNISQSLDAINELVQMGGKEPREEVVKDIDRKLKVWRTSNPAAKGTEGDGKVDGRDGKRHKSASKQQEVNNLEEAALDGS